MTPRHGKPLAGRQEILILRPKSFPKQRNGLPGQIAEILTAKFKKTHVERLSQEAKGLGKGPASRCRGVAWVFCPLARWWRQG